ncbi:uncharacterized protein BJ212DRAFT_1360549, partial [Suillus subaureus]
MQGRGNQSMSPCEGTLIMSTRSRSRRTALASSLVRTIRLFGCGMQGRGSQSVNPCGGTLSVSFSPDGTGIITGSNDETIRLWDAATRQPSQQCAVSDPSAFSDEHCTIETITTMKSNTWNNHFISFSSNSIHALCDTSELTDDTQRMSVLSLI